MCPKVLEGNFTFFRNNISKSSVFYYLEPCLYPYLTDTVEAKNTLIRERYNHSETCITVEMYRRTQEN